MIIQNFEPFIGAHCETTATGSLLKQLGLSFSEPMLFGLGEGLGYIFWHMKTMDFPFIGGRVKPDVLTENICRNLHLRLEVSETASIKKAWENVTDNLGQNKAVGLKLDCYHLDYFTRKIHFAGHYVAIYGFDEVFAYLVDTHQQGGKVRTTRKSLALESARSIDNMAKELHEILLKEHIQPPYLLAGHSFGGYILRLFTEYYPQKVAGLVFCRRSI